MTTTLLATTVATTPAAKTAVSSGVDPVNVAVVSFVALGGVLALLSASEFDPAMAPASANASVEKGAVLLDMRQPEVIEEQGSPEGLTTLHIPYTKGKTDSFLEFLITGDLKKSLTRDTPIVLLDADGVLAPRALRGLKAFTNVRFVGGGAAAWQASGLPWDKDMPLGALLKTPPGAAAPRGSPSSNGSSNGQVTASSTGKKSSAVNEEVVNATLVAAGAVGSAVLLFNEIETLLQMVGIVAAVQFLGRNLLYAEDREKTLSDLQHILDEKIAAGEVANDLSRLGSAISSGKVTEVVERAEEAAKDGAKSVDAAVEEATEKVLQQ